MLCVCKALHFKNRNATLQLISHFQFLVPLEKSLAVSTGPEILSTSLALTISFLEAPWNL